MRAKHEPPSKCAGRYVKTGEIVAVEVKRVVLLRDRVDS